MKLEQFMKKQRLISLLILLALLLSMGSVCVLAEDDTQEDVSDGPFEVDAKAAILIDMNTGRTVYEKNIDERIYPASLTKIMTCLLALENGNLSDIVTIDEGAFAGLDGNSSTAGLQVGEQLTFNDLLYCLMISSGNEAANAVAEHIAGSIPDFVRMMNERAYELGCTGTHFTNPNGLFDEDHYTTARDLANITRTAMKNKTFSRIVAAKEWNADRPGSTYRHFVNKNKTVRQFDGGNGVKIGYTKASGRTLAASATRDGKNVICVVMSAPNWFQDAYRLMEYGFDVL